MFGCFRGPQSGSLCRSASLVSALGRGVGAPLKNGGGAMTDIGQQTIELLTSRHLLERDVLVCTMRDEAK